jgi:hypothetical protein
MTINDLPVINATLNGSSAVLLLIAHNRIKRGQIKRFGDDHAFARTSRPVCVASQNRKVDLSDLDLRQRDRGYHLFSGLSDLSNGIITR